MALLQTASLLQSIREAEGHPQFLSYRPAAGGSCDLEEVFHICTLSRRQHLGGRRVGGRWRRLALDRLLMSQHEQLQATTGKKKQIKKTNAQLSLASASPNAEELPRLAEPRERQERAGFLRAVPTPGQVGARGGRETVAQKTA